jgi:hypothetical protein
VNASKVAVNSICGLCIVLLATGIPLLAGCAGKSPLSPDPPKSRNGTPAIHGEPSVVVTFPVGEPASITLRIMDAEGRQVREISNDVQPGIHAIASDGRTNDGRKLGSGVYFFTLEYSTGERDFGRVVLVR